MIDFRSLVKAGVHFGHQKTRWCPRMAPYIWGTKNNIHLIDVSKTAFLLEQAAQFLKGVAAQGQTILWVGTKKAAKGTILRAGNQLTMPHVSHRWVGGTLSNFGQVKKSVTRCLHFEDILSKSEQASYYTKKEFNTFQKIVDRLEKNIGGIKKLTWPVGAMVVVDIFKEQSAVKEAVKMGVPIIGLVDTNCDPTPIDYVIPTNDDAPRAINIIVDHLIEAVEAGVKEATAARKAKKEAAAMSKDKKDSDDKKERSKKAAPVEKKAKEAVKAAPKKAKAAAETKKADAEKKADKQVSEADSKGAAKKSVESKAKADTKTAEAAQSSKAGK